jgi:hypothetical protein
MSTLPPDAERAKKGYTGYLRFMGLGLTMLGIVLCFVFLGLWVDRRLHWGFPVFTLALSLLGLAGAMMHLFRETARK